MSLLNKHRYFICSLLISPALAYTAETTNTITTTLLVTIEQVDPTCSTNILKYGLVPVQSNEIDFGVVYPNAIQAAPSPLQDKQYLMNNSNFNNVYAEKNPTHSIYISCDSLPNVRFSVSLKNKLGTTQLPGDVSRVNLFKLDNTDGNQNSLAYAIYAEDRYSVDTTRIRQYTTHGIGMNLKTDSFRMVSPDQYDAYIDLYPGLFWINKANNTNYRPGELKTTITVNISFN